MQIVLLCHEHTNLGVGMRVSQFQREECKLKIFLIENFCSDLCFLSFKAISLCGTTLYVKILNFIHHKKITNDPDVLAFSSILGFPCITFSFNNAIIHSFPALNCNFLNEQL